MELRFNFIYRTENEAKKTTKIDNEDFSVAVSDSDGIISLTLKPNKKISFDKFEMTFDHQYKNTNRIFPNGYQSWTVSREYAPKDKMDEFNPRKFGVEKKNFNFLGMWGAGDLTFHQYPEKGGIFYGYSYGYIRQGGDITLYGSLSERAGYTIITFDTNESTVNIEKDLEGVWFDGEKEVLSLAIIDGKYDNAFDKYFELMNIDKPKVKRSCGYTTWYNYYTGVTEDIVRRDLDSISKLDTKVDIFQIDDGYERTVGDWLYPDEKKFPTGMKAIADEIHSNNMLAGLWLAPFAVTPKSYVFKEHRDWLVHDEKGRIHYASHNWGGFFALDIYNDEAREYIRNVFDTVLNVWGYDMVKLDFLYACCIIPIHGKSRGEIMCDAMDLLREVCGDKIILGCGVPLAPAFGKVDFCRIGADVGLDWDKKPFSREDVSTQNTLLNTVFRRHLDGRAFLNDPDVFLLRESNLKMPLSQREIIAEVNSLCGNLLFVSDDVAEYDAKQKQIFTETVTRPKAKILSASIDINDDISIDYSLNGENGNLTFNIKTGIKRIV
ncbi:MAG: alpha-galactosidase [Eubacteriales bacterium]|nr:alpha-galactosidase [Eubacteriales bacterium]